LGFGRELLLDCRGLHFLRRLLRSTLRERITLVVDQLTEHVLGEILLILVELRKPQKQDLIRFLVIVVLANQFFPA